MFESIKTHFAAWQRRRETVRELSMLTNRELADLGISRGDIPFVADGSLLAADEAFTSARPKAVLIGPALAPHAPTSLAA